MASLQDMTQKIMDDAAKKGDALLKAAQKDAEAICAASRAEAQKKREETLAQARSQAEVRKERMLAAAELEGRKRLLNTKQQMISRAFLQAVAEIVRMDDSQYDQLMNRMSGRFTGTVELLPRDKEKGTGGGFVVKDGKIELNYSLEALAKAAKDQMETEVAATLFGREGGHEKTI